MHVDPAATLSKTSRYQMVFLRVCLRIRECETGRGQNVDIGVERLASLIGFSYRSQNSMTMTGPRVDWFLDLHSPEHHYAF